MVSARLHSGCRIYPVRLAVDVCTLLFATPISVELVMLEVGRDAYGAVLGKADGGRDTLMPSEEEGGLRLDVLL